MASMNANEFAETTVNIQEERGQKVIDTGIYSMVRHPMYTGFIFFITGVNVWIGTYLSLSLSLIFLALALKNMAIDTHLIFNLSLNMFISNERY